MPEPLDFLGIEFSSFRGPKPHLHCCGSGKLSWQGSGHLQREESTAGGGILFDMIKRVLLCVSKHPASASETSVGLDLGRRHGAEIMGFTAVDPGRIAQEVPRGLLFTQSHADAIDNLVSESLAEAEGALVAHSGSLESAKALKQFVQLQFYPGTEMHLVTAGSPKSGEAPQVLLD